MCVLCYGPEQVPLYYEFDNRTEVERIVEIFRHASSRDAAFYFVGFFSAGLVAAIAYMGESTCTRPSVLLS
jgi:hypothetical protein